MSETNIVNIVPLEFWTDYPEYEQRDPDTGLILLDPETRKPVKIKREYDWVKYIKRGGHNQAVTNEKISRLQRDPILWPIIEPAYLAWKKGTEVASTGTPIDTCPFISKEQARLFKSAYIFSLEELASCSDAEIAKIGFPGVRALRDKARTYIENVGRSDVTEALALRDEQINTLKAELAEMRSFVKREDSEIVTEPQKRRGRKPKVTDEPADDSAECS